MEYSDKTIEHFMCPQNVGSMPDADAFGKNGNPSCGDYIVIFIKVKKNIIKEISYLVFGCSAAIASASMTSVLAKGKSLEEAEKITDKEVSISLGGLPEEKMHCSNIGVYALRSAIDSYKKLINKGVNNENCITCK